MPGLDRFGGILRQRRTPIAFVIIILLTVLHLRDDYRHVTPLYWQAATLKGSQAQQLVLQAAKDWTWNHTIDANNLLLTHRQCNLAFPDFFQDIDRSVRKHRAPAYNIKLEDLDKLWNINGFVRAMIYEQQLYVISTGGPIYSRSFAVLSQIHRALITSPERVPNIEFTFSVDDRLPPLPQWAFAREPLDGTTWLMPDFGFWSWPETNVGAFSEARIKAAAVDQSTNWTAKEPKLLWRGAPMGLPLREGLLDATSDKSWADVKSLDWHPSDGSSVQDLKSMDEHCRYKFLAHTEGNSYSGRLKYLQLCKSVIIAHPMQWVTHFSHLMKKEGADQNYLEVSLDWSDLESKIRHLLEWESLGERIASNSVKTFRERYHTPAAEVCYWRRLFKGWAEVTAFEPQFYDAEGRWRGVPFESYILERRLEWDPY